jgi:DNA-binding transcriptional MocR family regulator
MALASHANKKQKCWPSIKRLALMTGFSNVTVSKGLAELEELKLIDIQRRKDEGRPSVYTMLDTSHLVSKIPKVADDEDDTDSPTGQPTAQPTVEESNVVTMYMPPPSGVVRRHQGTWQPKPKGQVQGV